MKLARESQLPLHPDVQSFLAQPQKLLIGGDWRPSASGQTFVTINPATGETLAQISKGTAQDVDLAVQAARQAFECGPWSKTLPVEREAGLNKLADLILKHSEALAQLETLEMGMPISSSRVINGEASANLVRYFAGWPTKIHGEMPSPSIADRLLYLRREPIGVFGLIIPWNYPLLITVQKLAGALACGNTCVLKPASVSCLTALYLGKLVQEAGIPAGAVNIVTGPGGDVGRALSLHPGVDKISLTGSTEVGKDIISASTSNVKQTIMELGGKAPQLVFEDCDIDRAVDGLVLGGLVNNGQDCMAGCRIYVHEKIASRVVEKLIARFQDQVVGDGMRPDTQLGPVVSETRMNAILDYIESGRREGARLVLGGNRIDGELGPGYFIEPTIFADCTDQMTIVREEIFGPVVSLLTFKDEDEAIARANDTVYGLAAGVWTNNLGRAHRVAGRLQAGTIWVNCYMELDNSMGFGGYRQSGFGRELGDDQILNYTQTKGVYIATV